MNSVHQAVLAHIATLSKPELQCRFDWDLGKPWPLSLGAVSVTSSVRRALDYLGMNADDLVARHCAGDWGDIGTEGRADNEACLASGGVIVSSYRLDGKTVVWIITSPDRSETVVLLPSDSRVYRRLLPA